MARVIELAVSPFTAKDVPLFVMGSAKPTDVKRFQIIIMMGMSIFIAAYLTRFSK